MDSLISDFMVRENIPQPTVRVEGQGDSTAPAETPATTPVVTETPVAPATPATPPGAPKTEEKDHRAFAAARAEKAELRRQLDEREARLKELEALEDIRPKYEETTTRLTEAERLREEAEREREELKGYYRNESSALSTNPMEIPEVRSAALEAHRRLEDFLPDDLSADDETPFPMRKDTFIATHSDKINTAVEYWRQTMDNPNIPPADKGTLQHINLSQLAQVMGVDEKHFTTIEYRGGHYPTLDPRHPVFRQFKANMGALVRATNEFQVRKAEAESVPLESAKNIIHRRGEASLEAQKKMGIGVFGNDLKALRDKAPDNDLLTALAALEGHEDLVAELTAEQKRQGLLNAHKVRKYDIPVPDPKKYNETGRMLQAMDMERDVTAPLVKPLQKLAARQFHTLREKDAEIAKLRAEIDRRSVQGEAGSPRAGDSVVTQKPAFSKPGFENPETRAFLEKNGLI